MKKIAIFLLIVVIIIGLFYSISISQTIKVNDYIKDKFPSIFSFYLSSLEELDQYEKEFIDLLEKLPEEEQEYYAKEVYKNGFSLELLKSIKEGKTIKVPTSRPALPSLPKQKEETTENLPSIIKRIKPSAVIVFAYDNKGEFLKLGSGFFISQNGDIITNYHVLQGASSAEVKTSNGKTYPITYIVAEDEQSDIIRLSVDIPSQYIYPLSLSKTVPEVGERIIVYGSPLGLEKTASDGIVSAIREVPAYGKVIQITAPVSPGSSGSPVLNMKGEVIGIATFQIVEGQNLNFAIPSEKIVSLNLIEEKKTSIGEKLFEQEEKGKKDSDYAYEAYNKALYFIDKREYEKALPYLQIVIKIDPFNAYVYSYIGFCYAKLESHAKALEAYKEAIRIDPDYSYVYYNMGNAYHCLGNYTKAIEAYKESIRIDSNDAVVHYSLGFTYHCLGNYTKAIEAYKQAIRIDPDYFDAYNFLGVVYNELGNYTKAIEAFKRVIRIDPDCAAYYYNLGISYNGLCYYTKAIEAYKQAIRIYPDVALPYYSLGVTYGKLSLYKDEIETYKQAIRIYPDYVDAHFNLGFAYFLIGDKSSALDEYKILKELDIDKANELFNLIY